MGGGALFELEWLKHAIPGCFSLARSLDYKERRWGPQILDFARRKQKNGIRSSCCSDPTPYVSFDKSAQVQIGCLTAGLDRAHVHNWMQGEPFEKMKVDPRGVVIAHNIRLV